MKWTWILVGTGILGVILNNYKRKECFAIWMIGNASWCIVDWYYGLYSQSCLMGIYFILAIHGWCAWRKR